MSPISQPVREQFEECRCEDVEAPLLLHEEHGRVCVGCLNYLTARDRWEGPAAKGDYERDEMKDPDYRGKDRD